MKFLGHPVHQMLIVIPLGLFATAAIFDLIYLLGGGPTMAIVSYWMIAAGIIGVLIAAPFGWFDWFGVPQGTRAKSIGLWHGAGNVVVMLLFAADAPNRIAINGAAPTATAAIVTQSAHR